MDSKEFIKRAIDVANNYKTSYVWGTFGLRANASNMQRMINQYSKNTKYLNSAKKIYDKGFFFDCVGLIKGILWGWNGDTSKTYGGAKYTSNGVPDISADQMITKCSGVSTDFSKIVPGEAVWMKGHIGIYIGDGKVVESTPSWNSGVQITACKNIKTISGLNSRTWTKHGKLPYITYVQNSSVHKVNDMFNDISNSYAKEYINDLAKRNVINGYADGTFKPDNPVTRAEFSTMVLNVIKNVCKMSTPSGVSFSFKDTNGHWAENTIKVLAECGIVRGFEDGTFKPDDVITRGQAAIVTCNMMSYHGNKLMPGDGFPDIHGHYAEKEIVSLKAYGVLNGFEDGTFRPDQSITRAQAAIIVGKCIKLFIG